MEAALIEVGRLPVARIALLALPRRLALLLPLLLPFLLVGAVTTIDTAGGGAQPAVVRGIVADNATYGGALEATPGIGGRTQGERKRCNEWDDEQFHGGIL